MPPSPFPPPLPSLRPKTPALLHPHQLRLLYASPSPPWVDGSSTNPGALLPFPASAVRLQEPQPPCIRRRLQAPNPHPPELASPDSSRRPSIFCATESSSFLKLLPNLGTPPSLGSSLQPSSPLFPACTPSQLPIKSEDSSPRSRRPWLLQLAGVTAWLPLRHLQPPTSQPDLSPADGWTSFPCDQPLISPLSGLPTASRRPAFLLYQPAISHRNSLSAYCTSKSCFLSADLTLGYLHPSQAKPCSCPIPDQGPGFATNSEESQHRWTLVVNFDELIV